MGGWFPVTDVIAVAQATGTDEPWTNPNTVLDQIVRLQKQRQIQKRAFIIENLGFCKPSEAGRISFEDALRFENTHEEVYTSFGFELVRIVPKELPLRADEILSLL